MEHLAQSTVAILAIMNPLGAAVLFVGLTGSGTAPERRRLAVVATVAIVAILAVSALAGPAILRAFGISLAAFKAGGGLVILLMGLEMLRGTPTTANASTTSGASSSDASSSGADASSTEDSILVPFAMPLVAGPGSITTVIALAAHDGGSGVASTLGAVGISGLVVLAALLGAGVLERTVGAHGLGIALRFMGLILLAIGVQMALSGTQAFLAANAPG